ncbi:carbonic anhydrase 2 isoform X2 [Eupeodes corollae]|uniref:carbonic anhydrase 2 isoform X2 n=1 Tax=Eupeodes corollae TaxID=290404 RepID=UPI0024937522|nr:carbonic anhydrase 2 isoform X2 [Eupeodes corollae]
MFSSYFGFLFKAIFVILCYDLKYTGAQDFSYDGTMGPEHWGEQYNGCSGKYQSPINIDLLNVIEHEFGDLVLERFDELPISGDLLNNGHTVIVHLNYEDEEPTISGGPLNGTFRFAQLHFHWGDNDTYGSEDRINNQSFPAELHMVFYNTLYGSFEDAVGHSEGIAVMAFFYVLERENPYYADLSYLLSSLQEPDHHVPYINAPSLENLGGSNYKKYFTYIGSLTTPPCSEEVLWIDFEEPVMISRSQIEKFRHIYNHAGEPLTHNFRPIQPLNNRIVLRNLFDLKQQVNGDDSSSDRIDRKNFPSQSEYSYSKASTNPQTEILSSLTFVLIFNFVLKIML